MHDQIEVRVEVSSVYLPWADGATAADVAGVPRLFQAMGQKFEKGLDPDIKVRVEVHRPGQEPWVDVATTRAPKNVPFVLDTICEKFMKENNDKRAA